MQSGDDEASGSEIKDISVNKRLQISIPIPDDVKYLTDEHHNLWRRREIYWCALSDT